MDLKNEDQNVNTNIQTEFMTFLKDKQIDAEENNEKLFESFLLFQKFMNCMITKSVIERIEESLSLEDKKVSSVKDNESKLIDEGKQLSSTNFNEPNDLNEHKAYKNYDDIPIKNTNINFVELVEKNLAELQYQYDPKVNNDIEEKRKLVRTLKKNKTLQLKRDTYGSNLIQNRNRRNESPFDEKEMTKSLPKINKRKIIKPKSLPKDKKKKEKTKKKDDEEENPKELPIFIKETNLVIEEDYKKEQIDNQPKEKDFSLNQRQLDVLSNNTFNIVIPETGYEEIVKSKNDSKENKKDESIDSDEEIINNYDSNDEEEDLNNNENKVLLEELNRIKGSANKIINNPLYSFENPQNIRNKSNPYKKQWIKELQKLKEENEKVMKIKKDYKIMMDNLQKEIDEFNHMKKKEYLEIEKFKADELVKKNKLKEKVLNHHNSIKQQETQLLSNKKDKEEIEQLKIQVSKLQEENKLKDNSNKFIIDKLKKQLQEANHQIADLIKVNKTAGNTLKSNNNSNNNTYRHHGINNTNPNSTISIKEKESIPMKTIKTKAPSHKLSLSQKNSSRTFCNDINIKVIRDKDDINEDTYEMSFPKKYNVDKNIMLVSEESFNDNGKTIKTYSNKMKEILFSSGVKKKVFDDGYQIIFFLNDDIKQIYPNGRIVYYFSQSKITQTTLPDNCQVYLFPSGLLEKHKPDGTKENIKIQSKKAIIPPNSSKISRPRIKKNHEDLLPLSSRHMESNSNIKIKTIKHKNGSEVFEFI